MGGVNTNYLQPTGSLVSALRSALWSPEKEKQLPDETYKYIFILQQKYVVSYRWLCEFRDLPNVAAAHWPHRNELHESRHEFFFSGSAVVTPVSLHSGHFGMVRMKSLAPHRVCWPGINSEIGQFVRQ
jgi:hypothetical protein